MKKIRFILVAAIVAFVTACDEVEFEKAVIIDSNVQGIEAVQSDNGYNLEWQPLVVSTGHGEATYRQVSTNDSIYLICVSSDGQHFVDIKRTSKLTAFVSFDEVSEALNGNVTKFIFGICLADNKDFMFCKSYETTRGAYVKCNISGYGKVDGEGFYNYGETVVLKAIPDGSYKFICWGDGSTSETCKFEATKDTVVEAVFDNGNADALYTLTVSADNKEFGYVLVDGKELNGSKSFEYGSEVTLKAVPNDGCGFVEWSDGNTSKERTIRMTDNRELKAIFQNFTLKKYYEKTNVWFLGGDNETKGKVENGNIIINIEGKVGRDENNNPKVWDDNLEIIFEDLHKANGDVLQIAGHKFLMTFDITWNGEAETAGFRICSDADKYIKEITDKNEDFYKDWNPWELKEGQTNELEFNKDSGLGKVYTVGKGEKLKVEWGGKITDRGANYIGIEINLAGYEDENNVIHENGKGTFTISNFVVKIADSDDDDIIVFDMPAE